MRIVTTSVLFFFINRYQFYTELYSTISLLIGLFFLAELERNRMRQIYIFKSVKE